MNKQNPPADVTDLINLVHHRWNVPVLAELHRQSGAKFVSLAKALNVSRASLSTSLSDLMALGLVAKNPGHGHPMRPEYLLTQRGKSLGPHCEKLHDAVRRRNVADIAYRKWTLPLLATMGDEALRFNEFKSALPTATPRAITMGLKSMIAERWAARTLIDDYPPAAAYELRPQGQKILTYVDGLFSA